MVTVSEPAIEGRVQPDYLTRRICPENGRLTFLAKPGHRATSRTLRLARRAVRMK